MEDVSYTNCCQKDEINWKLKLKLKLMDKAYMLLTHCEGRN